jgi:serine/threonine protein kinase
MIDELGFDVWSFGCVLIDIFTQEPAWQLELSVEEICKLHSMKLFPFVPSDITGLLRDIVMRCLERNHDQRIKIDELTYTLGVYFESESNNNAHNQVNNIYNTPSENRQLNGISNFINELDLLSVKISSLITDDLMERTTQLKNLLEDSHNNSIKRYTENYTVIKEMLSEMSVAKIEKLDTVKENLMKNLLEMQQFYGNATRDIIEGKICK